MYYSLARSTVLKRSSTCLESPSQLQSQSPQPPDTLWRRPTPPPLGVILTMPVHQTTHDLSIWGDSDHFKGFGFHETRLRNSNEDAEYRIAILGANILAF
ncbi:hypothetical protein N7G274_003791 [Stereocaulon virgatum]|uniref:Uncharacterized protein n=1 Tax=Stereocaulon virgatum TaxID=373712 RepID=A0ABR4ACB2_9LECA